MGRNLDSPEAVIATMERKTSLGPEARGYFAAFVPDCLPGKGRWFEPYVHHVDSSEFVLAGKANGRLAYVCGADIIFEWLTIELQEMDEQLKNDVAAIATL